jgi:hypothetical protein
MSGNTTSLYTTVGSNVVNANNFTTLYNSSGQGILPQLPYGNANVEAFLNAGTDGGNTVEHIQANGSIVSNSYIQANGNLIVNGQSFLGNVSNVHIEGGTLNFILSTDGNGGLSWVEQFVPTPATPNPFIHFDVTSNANNQTFSNSYINAYGSNTFINLFKNGVNIEPTYFIKTNATTVQVNIPLTNGDTIDILASDATTGSSTPPAGNVYEIQYNGGGVFSAESAFTYQPGTNTLNVGNISATNITTANITSNRVNANYLFGDGGNISNITAGNITGAVPFATNATTASIANSVAGANVTGYVANATHATIADTANSATTATTAGTVTTNSQPNITSVGTLTTLTVSGVTNLGDVSNVRITGGFANYFLQTNGSGNLVWAVGTGNGGNGSPAGSNTYVQFNDGGAFGGSSGLTFDKVTQQLTANYFIGNGAGLTNIAGPNVTGQVTFAGTANSVAGANVTGTVANATFANTANVAYNVSAANITGVVNLANYATVANSVAGGNVSGQVSFAAIANGVAGANVSGVVANANYSSYAGNAFAVSGSNVSGAVANATYAVTAGSVAVANVTGIGNIATINLTGSSSNVLYGNGVFAPGAASANANYANFAGNAFSVTGSNVTGQVGNALVAGTVYTNSQPNITSTGTLSSLSVTGTSTMGDITTTNITSNGNVILQRAFEKFTPNGTGATGTINFDALNQSIVFQTASASGNVTLNIRGNSSTTLDSILPTNNSLTVAFLNTVTSPAYIVSQVQIDGVNVSPKYVNGSGPSIGTRLINATQSYTYSILKTGANTYTITGSLTEYQ